MIKTSNRVARQSSWGKIFHTVLVGDTAQLPPVGDKPLYHTKPSSEIEEQGYHVCQMFDTVVKLTENQHVRGENPDQQKFRELSS